MNRLQVFIMITGCALPLAAALAQPEQVVFNNVPSDGILGSSANALRHHTLSGGYPLGRIDLSGTLTRVHQRSWASDSRILITAPPSLGGQTFDFQPFPGVSAFTVLPFEHSIYFDPPAHGQPPEGEWKFRFYEIFDDGGPGEVDAIWNITITFTDIPPEPPQAVDLGELLAPGFATITEPFGPGEIRWYRFALSHPIRSTSATYLDIDTIGTELSGNPPDDTIIGLYDSTGALIALDADSGSGFTSQLSFGMGLRLPNGTSLPYDGRHGPLEPGVYYIAVASHPAAFHDHHWQVSTTAARSGQLQLTIASNVSPSVCYADCDADGLLNISDFLCFIDQFAVAQTLPSAQQQAHYANCTGATAEPYLSVADFLCFIDEFAQGCP